MLGNYDVLVVKKKNCQPVQPLLIKGSGCLKQAGMEGVFTPIFRIVSEVFQNYSGKILGIENIKGCGERSLIIPFDFRRL
jgi:hypothetical protein